MKTNSTTTAYHIIGEKMML